LVSIRAKGASLQGLEIDMKKAVYAPTANFHLSSSTTATVPSLILPG
jgi:hypothetical protein